MNQKNHIFLLDTRATQAGVTPALRQG